MSQFNWQNVSVSIPCPDDFNEKHFGIVHRGEKIFYRRYNREIKNGLSSFDIIRLRFENQQKKIKEVLAENLIDTLEINSKRRNNKSNQHLT